MRARPSVVRPFPTRFSRRLATIAAAGVTLVMLSSSLAGASIAVSGRTIASHAGQLPGVRSHAPTLTAKELQQSPFVADRSSAIANNPTARILSDAAPSAHTEFTIGFDLRNPQGLANVISAQETPGSPLFHQWLSTEQEMQMFGPDPVQVQNTITYYESMGFKVTTRGPISVGFTGDVAAASAAFRTSLSNVDDGQKNPEVLNVAPLEVPQPIAGSIASINGFEGIAHFHPTSMVDPALMRDGSAAALFSPVHPGVETVKTNETVAYNYTNHAFYWYNYFSHFYNNYQFRQVITPASLNAMYDANPLLAAGYNGNHTPGQQITIAIVMAGGINPDDMQGYSQIVWNNPHQLIDRISPVPVDHQSGLNGTLTYSDGGSGEMALDIEYSGTMAPGAKIQPVYGLCLCTNELDDDYAAIMALPKLPSIVSNSWGGEEVGAGSLTGPSWQNDVTMHNYFMLLTARGATVLASSADGGGFDTAKGILSGSFPATDPYVLSVDGVRTAAANATGRIFPNPSNFGLANITIRATLPNWPVHVNSADQMAYNAFWYTPFTNRTLYSAAPVASGGFGTSYWFNQSWFEHGLGVPDIGRSLGSGVAAEADFNQSIFFNGNFGIGWGGTSFACPTVAGMLGDVLDYLQAHGHSPYLGDGNAAVFWVGNAWMNHNLTVDPFFDVFNGTSYWGNQGVTAGWQWPPGQVFPHDRRTGNVTYGNTVPGWDFPTGWGVPDVTHFAMDLEQLLDLPAKVMTTNAGGTALDAGPWQNLATNQSYTFHINASGSLAASNPTLTVEFTPESTGVTLYSHPTLTASGGSLPAGFTFTLGTGSAPMNEPGLLIFTLGNASVKTAMFAYDWISWALPTGGTLVVSVVEPQGSSIVGGSATFGAGAGFFFPPIVADPEGFNGNNLLLVRVTYNGVGVYNARLTGTVQSPYDLAFEGSRALNVSQSYGQAHTQVSRQVSTSFTNLTGYGYVWTWNVIKPTTLTITANYSSATAQTNFTMVPPPNIALKDNYGGRFSSFNWIAWILYATRQPVTPVLEQLWAPNSINQSGWYDLLYTWAGERLKVNINDYQGGAVAGTKVWFGNWDLGRVTQFSNYVGSNGVIGYTNDTKSVGITDSSGVATIEIPQNESMQNGNPIFGPGGIGTFDGPAAIGAIAADIPGISNVTVSHSQPCQSPTAATAILLTCVFNDSVRRNYTTTPALVLPDPVNAWTQTPSGVHRDFFGAGSNLSFGLTVNLPGNDPWVSGYGFNWAPGPFHITTVTAYIDGKEAGYANPEPGNLYQQYAAFSNLSAGVLANGTHQLQVIVNVSSGQQFTFTHTFVVGSVTFDNLDIQHTYTVIPYNLNWTINLPSNEINNHTFSQSLEIQYVSGGCSGITNPCPIVVNLSEKIHRGVQKYNQSINLTMLNLRHFYSGAGVLPSGQYLITLWLNANHSGNVTAQIPTYLVFSDLSGAFTGPTKDQQVPLGNVTISYTYTGGYLSNATLFVFAKGEEAAPVYTTGIFVPAIGSNPRGGSASWFATVPGSYLLVMELGTPYTHTNISEWINVTLTSPIVYINTTHAANSALGGMSAASVGTVLAIAAAIIGFLIGLIAAPAFRGAPPASTGPKPSKPWEEMGGSTNPSDGAVECSVCHEHFGTPFALHTHQKVAHGIEE